MIVTKFGGTSVGSAESIQQVRQIVNQQLDSQPVVVVSALGGVTNLLVSLSEASPDDGQEIIRQLIDRHVQVINGLWSDGNNKLVSYVKTVIDDHYHNSQSLAKGASRDKILSIGETLSSRIVSDYFSEIMPAQQVIAIECIKTDDQFGDAEVVDDVTREAISRTILPLVEAGIVPVVTGYIGSTVDDSMVTTLGRGGSDYTAALVGHYLQAKEVQIWTDVDGVMSADPRVVKGARLIDVMSYEEAAELAAFGAKVLHPKTMRPAVFSDIPLRIANTFNVDATTTVVQGEINRSAEVVAVAAKNSVVMVNIYAAEMLLQKGFLSRISSVFADYGISIDIVSATEVSVSITLDNDERLASAIKQLEQFSQVTIHHEVGLVSLIGKDIAFSPKLITGIFNELAKAQIATRMISVGAEGVNVSLVLDSVNIDQAVDRLHSLFIGGDL